MRGGGGILLFYLRPVAVSVCVITLGYAVESQLTISKIDQNQCDWLCFLRKCAFSRCESEV